VPRREVEWVSSSKNEHASTCPPGRPWIDARPWRQARRQGPVATWRLAKFGAVPVQAGTLIKLGYQATCPPTAHGAPHRLDGSSGKRWGNYNCGQMANRRGQAGCKGANGPNSNADESSAGTRGRCRRYGFQACGAGGAEPWHPLGVPRSGPGILDKKPGKGSKPMDGLVHVKYRARARAFSQKPSRVCGLRPRSRQVAVGSCSRGGQTARCQCCGRRPKRGLRAGTAQVAVRT
jgi:hypothetical protein